MGTRFLNKIIVFSIVYRRARWYNIDNKKELLKWVNFLY